MNAYKLYYWDCVRGYTPSFLLFIFHVNIMEWWYIWQQFQLKLRSIWHYPLIRIIQIMDFHSMTIWYIWLIFRKRLWIRPSYLKNKVCCLQKRRSLAAVVIRSCKSTRFSTSVRYTSFLKYSHSKKLEDFDLETVEVKPPIQFIPYRSLRKFRTSKCGKCGCSLSCWNHIRTGTAKSISLRRIGGSWRKNSKYSLPSIRFDRMNGPVECLSTSVHTFKEV